MLDFIHGTLVEKAPTKAIINVHGIGFELSIPVSTYDHLPAPGSAITLKTYLHVREDLLQLFGFFSAVERTLFLLLIANVSGIGPKLAIGILSSMSVDAFCAAVRHDDVKTLTRIHGIGKRSAERLVVELRDKIHDVPASPSTAAGMLSQKAAKAADDAIAGLVTLGFKVELARNTVSTLVKELPDEQVRPESLIRHALRTLKS